MEPSKNPNGKWIVLRVNDSYVSLAKYARNLRLHLLLDRTLTPNEQVNVMPFRLIQMLATEALVRQGARAFGLTVSDRQVTAELLAHARGTADVAEPEAWRGLRDVMRITGLSSSEYREMVQAVLLEDAVERYLAADPPKEGEPAWELSLRALQFHGRPGDALPPRKTAPNAEPDASHELGWVSWRLIPPTIRPHVSALKPGERTPRVPMPYGSVVLECLDRKEFSFQGDKDLTLDRWIAVQEGLSVVEQHFDSWRYGWVISKVDDLLLELAKQRNERLSGAAAS